MEIKKNTKIVTNILVGIAITALIGGYLLGIFRKESEIAPGVDNQQVVEYAEKSQPIEDKNTENKDSIKKKKEDKSTDNPYGEEYESDLENAKSQDIDETKLAIPYEKIIGKEITKETKQQTKKFIEIFYNLDGHNPKKFIEESKDFMTSQLYESLLENPEVPTYEIFNRNYISSEIVESKKFTKKDAEEVIPYIVYVKGQTVDAENKRKKEVRDVYTILLVKDNNQYKIKEIYPNIFFE